jgi:hypothetical protein
MRKKNFTIRRIYAGKVEDVHLRGLTLEYVREIANNDVEALRAKYGEPINGDWSVDIIDSVTEKSYGLE